MYHLHNTFLFHSRRADNINAHTFFDPHLEAGRHDAGDRLQIDLLRDLLGLDGLVLVGDEHVAVLGLPAVLGDPLVHDVLVHQAQQLA